MSQLIDNETLVEHSPPDSRLIMYEQNSGQSRPSFPSSSSTLRAEVGDHAHRQAGSAESSTSSSPRHSISGNRARSLSLNIKSSQARSTAHVTQQQINRKRQRATPEQLSVLEDAFAANPSPNARMRESISTQINMTERSVQIWFQNRRAKTKIMYRKGVPDELTLSHASFDMRPSLPARSWSIDQGMFPNNMMLSNSPKISQTGPVPSFTTRLNCRSLTIGSWRRVACTSSDLICYFSHLEPLFTYYVNSGATGFKIEFPIRAIVKIDLNYVAAVNTHEMGRALITLDSCPIFFMEIPSSGAWRQCTDFTENQQGTNERHHNLVGPYQHLKDALLQLLSVHKELIDCVTFEDVHAVDFGIPMSSQAVNIAQANAMVSSDVRSTNTVVGRPLLASTPEQIRVSARSGHRRTRSRSAPIAVDLSWMNATHVEDLTNYKYGLQAFNVAPDTRYFPEISSASNSITFDGSDGLYTPATVATSSYQDTWYTSSYANTPLLDAECSQLGSPLAPGGPQFDLDFNGSQIDVYGNFADLGIGITVASTLPYHSATANISMPDLPRLDSVPEIPTLDDVPLSEPRGIVDDSYPSMYGQSSSVHNYPIQQ